MTLIENWVDTPLAEAVGWTLIHSLWQGAIFALALGALFVATRSPRVRYAAACIAMLIMLLGFCVTLALVVPEGSSAPPAVRSSFPPAWNEAPDTGPLHAPGSFLAVLAPWLAPFWMAGVCAVYLRQLAGWISVSRMRRRGVCCAPAQWQERLSALSATVRLTRPVLLLESCLINAPVVLGHLRPAILVPVGLLARLPAAQVEAILLHELAHVRRRDYLVNVLLRSIEGLLFYHPAAWWISRAVRAERENCCDDVAVAAGGNAHEYAVALATLERNRWSGREPALAATGGNLVKRIARLLYPKAPRGAWTPWFPAVALMIAAAAVLAAWQNAPAVAPAQSDSGAAALSPYDKWLNEDVVYIIDDRERAAFQKLAGDDEREKFIEQFWLRRDPTAGTPENEFKDEHYRRIAYANTRFRTASGKPGWRTDRGRIYILYGPPDEIESHAKGAQRPYATESWMYRHLEGAGNNLIVRFIDRDGAGDYQLVSGTSR